MPASRQQRLARAISPRCLKKMYGEGCIDKIPDVQDRTSHLALDIVREAYDYTSGRPQKWVDIGRIAQRLRLPETGAIEEAVRLAETKGWLILDGEHGLSLTEAGRRIVTAT